MGSTAMGLASTPWNGPLRAVFGEANASVTQYESGNVTLRSSAITRVGNSSAERCTCVSPEYQPSADMSIHRRNLNLRSTGSFPTVTTRVSGRYSLPRSTVNVYFPGGSVTPNG